MSQYHPPDYADNTDSERKMHTVLNQMLNIGEKRLDIANGFFEPSVWRMLGDELKGLASFRLLLGRPPKLITDCGLILCQKCDEFIHQMGIITIQRHGFEVFSAAGRCPLRLHRD